MIKLLIVDDQKILLDAFTKALGQEDDIQIAGSITEADVADAACGKLRPNMVLMDICTGSDVSGLYAAKRIKEQYPQIKVVLMTGFPELSFLNRARAAGADSFIYKSSSMEEFIRCIRLTAAGQGYYPENAQTASFGEGDCPLTARELEILRLFCNNLTRKEMASALGISVSTINFHINNMLVKTGYKNLMGLAMEAANKGYINTKI